MVERFGREAEDRPVNCKACGVRLEQGWKVRVTRSEKVIGDFCSIDCAWRKSDGTDSNTSM
jgi:hypothetical protein